jgi:hypothetical protein
VSDTPKGNELCAKCSYTYDGHIGNTGCLYPCWTPSGRYRAVPPSPSGEPLATCDCASCSPTRPYKYVSTCCPRGLTHGALCICGTATVKPDLTVASEEPPGCRQRAASLHPRLGLSYACVLTAGHNGECAPGGTCYEHGPYIGKPRTTPLCPKCPTPSLTLAEEPLPKRLGKSWQWPTPEELVDWEAKITQRHTRAISPGNQLLLIRAVRGQRKVIEKLTKLLAQATP